jgi:Leucine-rich repeat (LRR) protein
MDTKKISFNNIKLRQLPPLSDSLEELYCSFCDLTELPRLPPTLKIIGCANNKLRQLPILPHTLKKLRCNNNLLTELPDLIPTSLVYLGCSSNQLTELPELPPTLKILECDNNQLTELPALPPTLEELSCSGNQIKKITNIPINVLLRGTIDPTYLDLNSCLLYEEKLSWDIRFKPRNDKTIPIDRKMFVIVRQRINELHDLNKFNMFLLSRPEFIDGSMVDSTGKRHGKRGFQLGSVTDPMGQPERVGPDLIRTIGSYLGGKSKKQRKYKRSKYKKSKNNKSKKIRKKSKI